MKVQQGETPAAGYLVSHDISKLSESRSLLVNVPK
jgi:hypothetical protein